jgi:hypothetical protein
MNKDLRDGLAGMALCAAITLVFFFIADLTERLHAVDQTFGWWVSRQVQRIF